MIWFYIIPAISILTVIPVNCYIKKELTISSIIGLICAIIPVVNIVVIILIIVEFWCEFGDTTLTSWE